MQCQFSAPDTEETTVNKRTVYDVAVTIKDHLWVAVVKDLPGGAADAERLNELGDQVRGLIATLEGKNLDEFDVRWHYDLRHFLLHVLRLRRRVR